MSAFHVGVLVALLIMAKWAAQFCLERLNSRHVLARAGEVPEAFQGVVDEATYAKSVRYTLAKGRLDQIQVTYSSAVLLLVLFSGWLPWGFHVFTQGLGKSAWAMAAFLFVTAVVLSLPGLPLDWYEQFRLEESFGFNTTTQELWWMDRVKGLLVAIVL